MTPHTSPRSVLNSVQLRTLSHLWLQLQARTSFARIQAAVALDADLANHLTLPFMLTAQWQATARFNVSPQSMCSLMYSDLKLPWMNLIIPMTTKPLDTLIPTLLMLSPVCFVLTVRQRSPSRALVLSIQEKQRLYTHSQKILFRALME